MTGTFLRTCKTDRSPKCDRFNGICGCDFGARTFKQGWDVGISSAFVRMLHSHIPFEYSRRALFRLNGFRASFEMETTKGQGAWFCQSW